MILSTSLDDLHPHVADLCRQFIAKCHDAGIEVKITATYRDKEYQDWLYAQGRTRPGKIVTYAKGGQSWHNYRMAFDFCIIKQGSVDWGDIKSYRAARTIGATIGLEGLSFELAHQQARGGLTLAQVQAGKQPSFA